MQLIYKALFLLTAQIKVDYNPAVCYGRCAPP